MTATTAISILILLTLKHFFADWVYQGDYMLVGKTRDKGWVKPLSLHAGLHGIGTYLIVNMFVPFWYAGLIAVADTVLHFVVDRIKSKPGTWHSRFGPADVIDNELLSEQKIIAKRPFWVVLGLDQTLHHLTDILSVYLVYLYLT